MQAAQASGQPPPTVLDVRPPNQFDLARLPQAVHIPFEQLDARVGEVQQLAQKSGSAEASVKGGEQQCSTGLHFARAGQQGEGTKADGGGLAQMPGGNGKEGLDDGGGRGDAGDGSTLFVMCRRGNNSQLAVARLRELGITNAVDVVGGIENWAKSVDDSMPVI